MTAAQYATARDRLRADLHAAKATGDHAQAERIAARLFAQIILAHTDGVDLTRDEAPA